MRFGNWRSWSLTNCCDDFLWLNIAWRPKSPICDWFCLSDSDLSWSASWRVESGQTLTKSCGTKGVGFVVLVVKFCRVWRWSWRWTASNVSSVGMLLTAVELLPPLITDCCDLGTNWTWLLVTWKLAWLLRAEIIDCDWLRWWSGKGGGGGPVAADLIQSPVDEFDWGICNGRLAPSASRSVADRRFWLCCWLAAAVWIAAWRIWLAAFCLSINDSSSMWWPFDRRKPLEKFSLNCSFWQISWPSWRSCWLVDEIITGFAWAKTESLLRIVVTWCSCRLLE